MPEPALSIAVRFAPRNLRWTATVTLDRVVATSPWLQTSLRRLHFAFPKRPTGALELRRRLSCRGQIPSAFSSSAGSGLRGTENLRIPCGRKLFIERLEPCSLEEIAAGSDSGSRRAFQFGTPRRKNHVASI